MWNLKLHEAYPLPGGKFLFLGFGQERVSASNEFQTSAEKNLFIPSPHPSLVRGLLHLQETPAADPRGVLILEGASPIDVIQAVQDHLELGAFELYDLNLGRGLGGHAVGVLVFREGADATEVASPASVTRTLVDEISPEWRKSYLV